MSEGERLTAPESERETAEERERERESKTIFHCLLSLSQAAPLSHRQRITLLPAAAQTKYLVR